MAKKNFETSGSKRFMGNGGDANQFAGLVAGLGGGNVDPTRQPQAKTGKDVQGQDWQTRLWQSYQNAARYQTDASNKAYGLARGAADRQATSRGMGRSSYNNATLSNIDIEKVNAANKIQDDAIAAYQQAFQNQTNIENQMAWDKEKNRQEQERWQKEFEEKQRQWNEQMGLNREQFDWQKQQAAQSGSGGGGNGSPGKTNNPTAGEENGPSLPDWLNSLFGGDGLGNPLGNLGNSLGTPLQSRTTNVPVRTPASSDWRNQDRNLRRNGITTNNR